MTAVATPVAETTVTNTGEPTWRSRQRVTTPNIVKSEWIKFWSLRSTWITLLSAVLVFIGMGVLVSSIGDLGGQGGGGQAADAASLSLSGTMFAQLVLGTLGVLLTATEYSTGMIRSTLSAVPKRLPVLWAKIIVFTSVVFTVSLGASLIAFFAGQAVLGADGVSLSDTGVLGAVIGTAGYLTGAGILGLALGALLRSTAGAVTSVLGLLFVLPGISMLLPASWSDNISPYLPSNAGSAFSSVTQAADQLSPATGLAVFTGYLAIAVTAAAWRLKTRDA